MLLWLNIIFLSPLGMEAACRRPDFHLNRDVQVQFLQNHWQTHKRICGHNIADKSAPYQLFLVKMHATIAKKYGIHKQFHTSQLQDFSSKQTEEHQNR